MSKWTHSICNKCYQELEPNREPARIIQPDTQACCKCTEMHSSGIFYRADPAKMACDGRHD